MKQDKVIYTTFPPQINKSTNSLFNLIDMTFKNAILHFYKNNDDALLADNT